MPALMFCRSARSSHPALLLATALFTGLQTLPLATAAWATSPAPGIIIENQATGSFSDPRDGNTFPLQSNTVQLTVAEVAGITATPTGVLEAPSTISNPGPQQGNGNIDAADIVYFIFEITNVGNDPSQLFIPGAVTLNGGTQAGPLEMIALDTDGPSGPTAPIDFSGLPLSIQPAGNTTGQATVLGLPSGALPAGGSVTLRVPVQLDAGLTPGDSVTVTLGDTAANDNSATTQNQPYSASGLANPPDGGFDLYTQDNADTDGIAAEAPGAPLNGDATHHRQEASATHTLTLTAAHLTTDYGDAPDSSGGTGPGNYATTAADNGAAHTISPDLYLGAPPDGDDGTQQSLAADGDEATGSADEGDISLAPIAATATSYELSNIAVTNTTDRAAQLVAWIDFNQDGAFDPAEATTVAVPNTGSQTVNLTWASLPGLIPGQTYARFRLTTDLAIATGTANTSLSTGLAADGEVEDYPVTVATTVGISGTLYQDLDGSDSYGHGSEPTLPAEITVRLLDSSGATEMATTTTNASGFYQFVDLPAGTYQVLAETTDPQIPPPLLAGTPTPLTVTLGSSSLTEVNFGFDSLLLSGAGGFPSCTSPYGEVYVSSGPDIYAVHAPTGAWVRLTTSGLVGTVDSLGTNPVDRLVYYVDGTAIYAWDAVHDSHLQLSDINGNMDALMMPGASGFTSLGSGGAAFYNGSLYVGVDPAAGGTFEVYRVDFVPGSGGQVIQSITALDVNGPAAANGALNDGDWGDLIIDHAGILYASSGGSVSYWRYDLNTNTYTDLIEGGGLPPSQLAQDGTGQLWAFPNSGSVANTVTPIAIANDTISITSGQENSVAPLGVADAGECVIGRSAIGDRVWNDVNGDGVQDPGEPGIANVTVGLYRDVNNNGLDAADPLLGTQVTQTSGHYDFAHLISGNYIVAILEGAAEDLDGTNGLANSVATTATQMPVTLATGIVDYNDADFGYQLGQPQVLLIKRITAINGQPVNPNTGVALNTYVDGSGLEDNHAHWPSQNGTTPDLFGLISAGEVRPNDEVEYTIYFLSAGSLPAHNVTFCDRIPDGQTFIPDAFNDLAFNPTAGSTLGEDRGVAIATGNTHFSYTNIGGDDIARFYPPTSGLPPVCNTLIPNTEDNGAIVVELGTLTNATGPGTPTPSFGHVRFRARVEK